MIESTGRPDSEAGASPRRGAPPGQSPGLRISNVSPIPILPAPPLSETKTQPAEHGQRGPHIQDAAAAVDRVLVIGEILARDEGFAIPERQPARQAGVDEEVAGEALEVLFVLELI